LQHKNKPRALAGLQIGGVPREGVNLVFKRKLGIAPEGAGYLEQRQAVERRTTDPTFHPSWSWEQTHPRLESGCARIRLNHRLSRGARFLQTQNHGQAFGIIVRNAMFF
jgi:hypothetical protein